MPGIGRFVRRVPVVRALYTRMLAAWFGPQTIADVQSLNRLLVELDRRVADLESDWSGHVSRMKREVDDGVTALNHRLEREDGRLIAIEGSTAELMDRVERESARARRAYSDLSARFANLKAAMRDGGAEKEPAKSASEAQDEALSPLLSRFYATFEDRFRGSREEIRDRVAALLPEVRETLDRLGGGRVVDLGCGRGEWLEVVQQAGYDVLGVDNNEAQLGSARERGLPVLRADALEWLCAQPDGSIAVATAFHLVEHLPFPVLVRFCLEIQRVLAPGGSLLFETPNPENVLVGAWSFHLDPTHQKPLPPELLECLLDTVGFEAVKVRMLHPHPWRQGYLSKGGLPPEVVELLFGPRDYAVVASKPR